MDMSVFFVYCLCKRIFSSFCNTMKAHKNFKKNHSIFYRHSLAGTVCNQFKKYCFGRSFWNMQFFILSTNKHLQHVILTIFLKQCKLRERIEKKTCRTHLRTQFRNLNFIYLGIWIHLFNFKPQVAVCNCLAVFSKKRTLDL